MISVLTLQTADYNGWEEFTVEQFANTNRIITIGEELHQDTGGTVGDQDRYFTLRLSVAGEIREVKVALLFGYRTGNNLQARTAFAYTDPETGQNTLIPITRLDQKLPSGNSTELGILLNGITTLKFLSPTICPPQIIENMAYSGNATLLVDQDFRIFRETDEKDIAMVYLFIERLMTWQLHN